MNDPIEFLDLDDVIVLAIALLGDPPPIRDIGLLGSAVARPLTTAVGDDAYPHIWTKAGACCSRSSTTMHSWTATSDSDG